MRVRQQIALLAAVVLLCPIATVLSKVTHLPPPDVPEPDDAPEYYFWNEMSGKVQWDDPGDVPYEDETGEHYWLGTNGDRLDRNPEAQKYSWVEGFSNEHGRHFYYNQESGESTWERPIDLAWRRVPVPSDEL